jgi:hypothetical protein
MIVSTSEPNEKDREAVAKVKLMNITLFRDNSLYHAFP